MEVIPVYKPLLEAAETQAAVDALDLGWLGMGGYVGEFEDRVRELVEAPDRHVVAVSTGHAALHMALLLAGVGPGDEVVTPSFNNVADFQAILATGAEPVFCDIYDETLCIDVEKAEFLVTPRTKAIIAMDYDCHLCDHAALGKLAEQHELRVVHDAAHSFGSRYQGKAVGSFSDITMFSFDPVKTITCIDGGALVLQTEEELTAAHEMRLIGMGQPSGVMYRNQRAWTYDVRRLGFRYHLANLHAAIGLAQLDKFDEIAASRRFNSRYYTEHLADLADLGIARPDFDEVVPFMYYVRVAAERRDAFREHLHGVGVDTGVHWQPGHWFSLFAGCRQGDLSVTERVGREIVTLPFHSKMSTDTLDRVIAAVRSFFIS